MSTGTPVDSLSAALEVDARNYTDSKKKVAEHGGMSDDDRKVTLWVVGASTTAKVVAQPVETRQIARDSRRAEAIRDLLAVHAKRAAQRTRSAPPLREPLVQRLASSETDLSGWQDLNLQQPAPKAGPLPG